MRGGTRIRDIKEITGIDEVKAGALEDFIYYGEGVDQMGMRLEDVPPHTYLRERVDCVGAAFPCLGGMLALALLGSTLMPHAPLQIAQLLGGMTQFVTGHGPPLLAGLLPVLAHFALSHASFLAAAAVGLGFLGMCAAKRPVPQPAAATGRSWWSKYGFGPSHPKHDPRTTGRGIYDLWGNKFGDDILTTISQAIESRRTEAP
jgi:hypothetical protein